jgi:hypothetical protein|tara:strand:+ start:72 stop:257 length:186 start_codon:yes stop_codon:yes gene_type:complete
MTIKYRQERFDKLDSISESLRNARELAREEDTPRDIEIRLLLALAISDIDILRGEHYEDYI